MKKPLSHFSIYFLFLLAFLFQYACVEENNRDVSINPDHILNPPIAEQLQVRFTDNASERGGLIVEALIRKETVEERAFAMQVDGQKIVFRDDGTQEDAQANDGVYTAFVQIEWSEIKDMLEAHNEQIETQEAQATLIFNGRNIIEQRPAFPIDIDDVFKEKLLPHFPTFTPPNSLIKNSILINDISVIEDPNRTYNPCTGVGTALGPWTFGSLMTAMANETHTGVSVSDFTLDWLNELSKDSILQGETIFGLPEDVDSKIQAPWLAQSRRNGKPEGVLDMSVAPFRLLAIVNRVDLRKSTAYGSSNAGEARFVFCLVDLNDRCNALDYTVIFEYGIEKNDCGSLRNWARDWYHLKNLSLGSEAYNSALQRITDSFTRAGASISKVNRSALNQLRIEDHALTNFDWFFREFRLDASTHFLKHSTLKQTPRDSFNQKPALSNYVNANIRAILNGTYVVPDSIAAPPRTIPFLASRIFNVQTDPSDRPGLWDGAVAWTASTPPTTSGLISNHNARHLFSLGTCNGCHGVEANVPTPFHHIHPADYGQSPMLSGFLTGQDSPLSTVGTNKTFCIPDPLGRPIGGPDPCPETLEMERGFNDLARRAQDLNQLVNMHCVFETLLHRPMNMTH